MRNIQREDESTQQRAEIAHETEHKGQEQGIYAENENTWRSCVEK